MAREREEEPEVGVAFGELFERCREERELGRRGWRWEWRGRREEKIGGYGDQICVGQGSHELKTKGLEWNEM